MSAPKIGSWVEIQSYKHNGTLHRVWEETMILQATKQFYIGVNDKTKVTEYDGHTWRTKEPAVCYFHSDYWFNVIGTVRTDGVHYYCNMSSPILYDQGALKYIDYDLDIKVYPDMTIKLLDEDEYELHKEQMNYPEIIERILFGQIDILKQMIYQKKGPFVPGFLDYWYERFLTYRS